jgi:hypothetical protein
MDDLYSIIMGSQPDAKMSAQAIAAALRGDRQLAGVNAMAAEGPAGLARVQMNDSKMRGTMRRRLWRPAPSTVRSRRISSANSPSRASRRLSQ